MNGVFYHGDQKFYTYNSDNNLINNGDYRWSTNDHEWKITGQTIYYYDTNNNVVTSVAQDLINNEYTDISITSFEYDQHNNLKNKIIDNNHGNGWENDERVLSNYDENNNKISSLYSKWEDDEWENDDLYGTLYDSNNFILVDSSASYASDEFNFINAQKRQYFFHTAVGVNLLLENEIGLTTYPNPGDGSFILTSREPLGSVEVYNQSGAKVYSAYFGNELSATLDLRNFPKGVYLVSVHRVGSLNYRGF